MRSLVAPVAFDLRAAAPSTDIAATALIPRTDPAYPRHQYLAVLVSQRLPIGELAHDHLHLERVYRWCLHLAHEAGADRDLAGATGLVHDAVFVPKDSSERSTGGERSAAIAPELLKQAGYNSDAIAAIAEAVRTSSWSRGLAPTGQLGRVLQDADRLDAIGIIGLLRTATCGQFMSSAHRPGRLYHAHDPLFATERDLDDRAQVIDHAFAKLLRLAHDMHLPTARQEALRRHAALRQALTQLSGDLADPGNISPSIADPLPSTP